MLKLGLAVAAALGTFPAIAYADCNSATTDAERAQCVGHDLRESDTVINDIYTQLRARLSPQGQSDLRHEEIGWIKARAQACRVDTKEPDRDKWIANLLKDFDKTVCVVRFTQRRIAQLRAQQAALAGSAPGLPAALPPLAVPPASIPAPPVASETASTPPEAAIVAPTANIYELDAQRSVSHGKWYFEAALDRGEIAKTASAAVFIGVKGPDANASGSLQTIHPNKVGEPKVNIGVAVDLDNGKIYLRFNGAWRVEPGSAAGADLKLGRPYRAALTSSVPLGPYLIGGLVDVNLGQRGFVYAVPDGYQPMDTVPPIRVVEQ